MPKHLLDELFHPRTLAVVGATGRAVGGPNFFSAIHEFGFKGPLFPVNPKYDEISGFKCYPTVKDIPGPVDYVVSSVNASRVLEMIDDCAEKGVKVIHLFTARFSETGRKDAAELEQEVLRRARKANIRLLGPNCMGLYFPEGGISFRGDLPKQTGSLGLISQSGSVIFDVVDCAKQHSLYFSNAISYGNALDFNECDFLDYLGQDENTKIILMYIEGVRNGPAFFDLLRKTTKTKPVIIVKGGRGESGTRATASHTASLAGSMKVWKMAVKQAGAVAARHIEEMVDIAAAFHHLPPVSNGRVGVAGGAGGSSVLAADLCEEAGLNVIPFPQDLRERLKAQGSQIWDWISNPVDMSIRVDRSEGPGGILKMMSEHPDFDLLMGFIHVHFHGPKPVSGNPAKAILDEYGLEALKAKPFMAVIEGGDEDKALFEAVKEALHASRIPIYPNIERAAIAASKMIDYYQQRNHREG
jgi:acyl-CoA synthetase (NDP forming)